MDLLTQMLLFIAFCYVSGLVLHSCFFKYKQTLILDVSMWKCGACASSPNNRIGKGVTKLLNQEGYMCCLGQFYPQLDKRVKHKRMLYMNEPKDLKLESYPLTRLGKFTVEDSNLSKSAIEINDYEYTTVQQKISLLKRLFAEYGYRIKVINMDKIQLPNV